MKGAHGLRPAGHEHARCRYCLAEAVHVSPATSTAVGVNYPGAVMYAPHPMHGGTAQCARSILKIVDHADRGRPAPDSAP